MKYFLLPLCAISLLVGQSIGQNRERRLPNGKLWADEISRADYERNLQDARRLATLSVEIRDALEDGEWYVLSLKTLEKTEEAEKLAKDLKDRLRKN